jgi:hypothetical protein
MTDQPCPIYPEGCHDPGHCVLGSPCVQADDELLDAIGTRQRSRPGESTGGIMNEQEMVEQILTAWSAALDGGKHPLGRRAAELAVRAMSRPREWVAGDVIPADVHLVATEGGTRFRRSHRPDGSVQWTMELPPPIPEKEFLSKVGPVREITIEDWEDGDWESIVGTALSDDREERASTEAPARRAESELTTITAACDALARAVDVLMYISVKLGVGDAKRCRHTASWCDKTLTNLTQLVEDKS